MPIVTPRATPGYSLNASSTSVTELLSRHDTPWEFATNGGRFDSTAVDAANSPTTTLRAGLIVAKKTSDSLLYEWGKNFAVITSEAKNGTGSATQFALAQDDVVPGSVSCLVGTVATTSFRMDYKNGIITFNTAPASGTGNIVLTYTHKGTLDGTEIPYGVLGKEVNLLNSAGVAQDTDCSAILIGGYIDATQLIYDPTAASRDYGRYLLSTKLNFKGLTWDLNDFQGSAE